MLPSRLPIRGVRGENVDAAFPDEDCCLTEPTGDAVVAQGSERPTCGPRFFPDDFVEDQLGGRGRR
jgi:hypothetical protein